MRPSTRQVVLFEHEHPLSSVTKSNGCSHAAGPRADYHDIPSLIHRSTFSPLVQS